MAKPKRTKEQLCIDNWEALFMIHFYGWGIMFLYQLDQYIMMWKKTPRSTFRDEVERMVESGILAKHRVDGKYCVRIRQSGINYIRKEYGCLPEYKYVCNKKQTAQPSTRAVLKSMLANGYLQDRIKKVNKNQKIEDYDDVFKSLLTATSVWFRDGYNHFAIKRYLHYSSSVLKQDEKEWFENDIEYRHNQLKENIKKFDQKGSNNKRKNQSNYRVLTETTLCTLAKKYVYLWKAIAIRKRTNYQYNQVKMIILEVVNLSPMKAAKMIAECDGFCRRYFGRVGSGRIELVVEIVVDSKDRSQKLFKGISKYFKTKYCPIILPETTYRVIPISDFGLNHPMV